MSVAKSDFSELAPFLIAGINSKEVEEFKKRNRDVQLTLDAGLQTTLQKSLLWTIRLKTTGFLLL